MHYVTLLLILRPPLVGGSFLSWPPGGVELKGFIKNSTPPGCTVENNPTTPVFF